MLKWRKENKEKLEMGYGRKEKIFPRGEERTLRGQTFFQF